MRREVTLLVTSAGGTLAPSAFLELRKSQRYKYRLVGVNASSPIAAEKVLDAFYPVPGGGSADYVPALLEVIRKESVEVVLPGSDEEAFALSSIAKDLEAIGVQALVSPPECLTLISDKYRTYSSLAQRGMRVPEFTFVTDSEGLRAALEKYDYPEKTVIIKPCRGRGGRGLHVLCGGDNPPTWLGRGKRETRVGGQDLNGDRLAGLVQEASLVMPCLRAPAYDADVVFVGGGRYSIILRKRVNPAGIPFEGNRIIPDAKVLAYCREVAVCLGLRAMHDIDLMTNSDGDAVVLEVNPRPSGSLAASLAAGFPLIDWAVSAVLGFEVEIAEPKKEIEVRAVPCALAITV